MTFGDRLSWPRTPECAFRSQRAYRAVTSNTTMTETSLRGASASMRRLKTGWSERDVPLKGSAQRAAERIIAQASPSNFAFPRNNRDGSIGANAASASLDTWLKPVVPRKCTMHSFRHSMRDRRAVECPADIVDQIGGWRTEGIGYGYKYPMDVLRR